MSSKLPGQSFTQANAGKIPLGPRPATVIALLLVMTGCGGPKEAAPWKTFSPPDGKFSVLLPGKPVEQSPKPKSGEEVTKKWDIVSALSNISALSVSYSDPAERRTLVAGAVDPKTILNKVRDNAVANLRGTLLSDMAIEIKGHPGREFQVSVPGAYTVRERIYLVKERLFGLMVISSAKGTFSPEAERFFNSFQILP